MGRRTVIVAFFLTAAAGSAWAQSPLETLQRLIQPPVDAITETFERAARPQTAPEAPAARRAAPEVVDVPLPRLRPTQAQSEPEPEPEPEPEAATVTATPPVLSYQPEETPAAAPAETATAGGVPRPRLRPPGPAPTDLAALPREPLPDLKRPPPAAQSTCGVALAMLGVTATPLGKIAENRCGIAAPVSVAALDDGAVSFTVNALIECRTAETLATWIAEAVQPQAMALLGEPVTGLRIAASYACRGRNNREGAKLSEHGKGNAIDISAFRVGDRWIGVGPGWKGGGTDAAFLKAVRKSACGPFKTVLGPGSDAHHSDHFHFDLAKRRSGRTYCR